jgi:hypothetical protein
MKLLSPFNRASTTPLQISNAAAITMNAASCRSHQTGDISSSVLFTAAAPQLVSNACPVVRDSGHFGPVAKRRTRQCRKRWSVQFSRLSRFIRRAQIWSAKRRYRGGTLVQWLDPQNLRAVVISCPECNGRSRIIYKDAANVGRLRQQIFDRTAGLRLQAQHAITCHSAAP